MTDTQHDVPAPVRSSTGTNDAHTTEATPSRSWSIANPRRVRLP